MIRLFAFLAGMLAGVSAYAQTVQQLERDTSSRSLVDLSNGEPGWREVKSANNNNNQSLNAPRSNVYWGTPQTQFVSGYFRRDGTYVPPYMRTTPRW